MIDNLKCDIVAFDPDDKESVKFLFQNFPLKKTTLYGKNIQQREIEITKLDEGLLIRTFYSDGPVEIVLPVNN